MLDYVLKKIMGTKHERELRRLHPKVDAINALEPSIKKLSDDELRARTGMFREQLEKGASLSDLLVPAFAVVREASRRALGMRHYDVQLIGGIVLHEGKIAEMKTGEGKTLVATLPCYLNALEGKGVHVVTVNDYLASRDAEWMGKVYGFLGMTTGVISPQQRDAEKKKAYRCDITYGQNNEYGFDYLRDNMKFSIYDYAQRELNYAIVDEVDSILIDEARTPLIISGPGQTASEKYTKINEIVPRLRKDEHYSIDEKNRSVTLTEEGMETAQRLLHQKGLTEVENLYDPVNLESLHILQQCLRAHTLYLRDRDYMVDANGKVLIIDEFTGRVLPGRRWSDGLHQAVEAKELVSIQDENITLATISFQNLFRLYKKLAGMTGTADTEAGEFHKIYKLDVVVIPTNTNVVRDDFEDLVYKTEREKFKAVSDEIAECHERGQPVLVGTTSVEKSDALSRMLERRGIRHNVLNAKQHEREAYIVAQAGTRGAVTVATNMAGRGTDIVLGGNAEMLARLEVLEKHGRPTTSRVTDPDDEGDELEETAAQAQTPELSPADLEAEIARVTTRYKEECERERVAIRELGGLHILGTERHDSRRVDNQLRGRSGRQGDPGSSRFYLSLEDDLMRIFAGERIQRMMDRLGMEEDVPIEHRWVTRAVENAQKKVEERNFDMRKNLLEYDDVMNQQRKSIYGLRKQVLMGEYRTVPNEEEQKKGKKPEPIVTKINEKLQARALPILEQIVKFHSTPLPNEGATPDEVNAHRERVNAMKVEDLTKLRPAAAERDVYVWFGCQVPLNKYKNDPKGAFEHLKREVGMSLTEQQERLLDLVDEIVGMSVEKACPPNRNFEDWDFPGLSHSFEEQFGIPATGLEKYNDREELAEKLYGDAEAVLFRKEEEIGSEQYLRLFRNFYLREIDNQWLEHLQSMDHLRDGIGLRGYGQRDPKKEYKREGFDLFLQMMQGIKNSVCANMLRVERVREEDLQRLEAQRRRQVEAQQRRIRADHPQTQPDAAAGAAAGAARGAPPGGGRNGEQPMMADPAGVRQQTVRRERPKIGRNDPCWCGSGKKYKNCHYREDRAAEGATG